jgi:hypothetical protein
MGGLELTITSAGIDESNRKMCSKLLEDCHDS